MLSKFEIRKQYRALRNNLTTQQIEDFSIAIANNTLQLPIWHKHYYHIFLSITKLREVNTNYILHILSGKDKHIVVSKSNFKNKTLSHYLLSDNTKLKKNKYHILEPTNGIKILNNQIEVVFVPLLAFDKQGHRLGYGKGFYDRFLSKCNPETVKIGLSFFEALNTPIDFTKKDVALTYCITPGKVYEF